MIIECINCAKKFDVNAELIPADGRTIQCGSCNHVWFFKINNQNKSDFLINDAENDEEVFKDDSIFEDKITKKDTSTKNQDEQVSLNKDQNDKVKFKLSKLLSYIVVIIISFVAFVIILDTFKTPLNNFFPSLELILFNLFETLKDILLFIKDLI